MFQDKLMSFQLPESRVEDWQHVRFFFFFNTVCGAFRSKTRHPPDSQLFAVSQQGRALSAPRALLLWGCIALHDTLGVVSGSNARNRGLIYTFSPRVLSARLTDEAVIFCRMCHIWEPTALQKGLSPFSDMLNFNAGFELLTRIVNQHENSLNNYI